MVFLAPYRHDIGTALDRTSAGALAGLTALSLLGLALRTEAWRVALAAADVRRPRSDLHAANAGTFLVSLANHYLGPWAKMWLLRRMEGEGATQIAQLFAVDVASTMLEAFAAAGLVVFATLEFSLSWWLPVLVIGGSLGLLAAAVMLRRRFPEHPAVQGLSVLLRTGYRGRVLGLLALVFAIQILRTWLSLRVVGLHVDVADGMLVFVVTGLLGALPSGIAAAPTAASLLVVGSHGVGRAAGAGVLSTVALFAATLIYCAIAAYAFGHFRRRALLSVGVQAEDR